MPKGKIAIALAIGFSVGAIAGFVYSSGVKSRLSQNIKTRFNDGKFEVSVDVMDAAVGGLADLIK